MVPDPDCMADAQRCSNGSAHAARLVSARQYAGLNACLENEIRRESMVLVLRYYTY